MNNRKVLEAIQEVEEIGCLSPNTSPPDIIGILAYSIHKEIPWDSLLSLIYLMGEVKVKFDLTSQDVSELLELSDGARLPESPKERRDRLLDTFAARVENEELLASLLSWCL